MNVIISNYPENLKVPAEYVENVTAAAEKVGELYGVENGEVSITLTDNAYIHELNREYRGIDRPTDVLSFALNESEEPEVKGGAAMMAIRSGVDMVPVFIDTRKRPFHRVHIVIGRPYTPVYTGV